MVRPMAMVGHRFNESNTDAGEIASYNRLLLSLPNVPEEQTAVRGNLEESIKQSSVRTVVEPLKLERKGGSVETDIE